MTAAKNVPTKFAVPAGTHGRTYIVESDAVSTVRSGGVAPNQANNPGALAYTTGVDAANRATTMAQEREEHEANLKMFHTMEGGGGHHRTP